MMPSRSVYLLDYGAGNVRSVRNAIRSLGYEVQEVSTAEDLRRATCLVFPGVGEFGHVMAALRAKGLVEPLREYIQAGRSLLAVCVGMQALFEASDESPGVAGLGVIAGTLRRFASDVVSVPQIGWNRLSVRKASRVLNDFAGERMYFVHSYCALESAENASWILSTTVYGRPFISAVQRGNVVAFQFHPEKSGSAGVRLYKNFLENATALEPSAAGGVAASLPPALTPTSGMQLAKRVIACLDVRPDDDGRLVVTKGDQYDVREKGKVRNLGDPVEMAGRYYREGADEVTFLSITSFKNSPLADNQMLDVLRRTSENVFVPLTIGGGIRDYVDRDGRKYSALEVASEYFRSGADKVSIGSDAVAAAEAYWQRVESASNTTTTTASSSASVAASSIEQIAAVYGSQAVVISVDPRRVYVSARDDPSVNKRHRVIETTRPGPRGEKFCWFQCTVKGGREGRDLDVPALVVACERLGAGEILLNSLDMDGQNRGYDLELIALVKSVVTIPVIASSGAGNEQHFVAVFQQTRTDAALAAGIFHRNEVSIRSVKEHLERAGLPVRLDAV